MMQLEVGRSLQGRKYIIKKVLGQGGFGITYLATHVLLDREVCIKEFFIKDACIRASSGDVVFGTYHNHDLKNRLLNKFIKEARTISKLEHSNIIHILDVFKENGTAYYVMDFIEGYSLDDIVNNKGRLSESEAIKYIKQIANALDYIHKLNINHLDVKPSNIMIQKKDKKAVLIDFGVSKHYDEQGEQTSTTPVGISYGYAPIELYRSGSVSEFSPQVDIYSLGATLYRIVTGNRPPYAIDLLMNDELPNIELLSTNVALAIKTSMQAKYQSRPQNITEFIDILNLNKEDREDNEGCEDIKESKESRIIIQTSLNSPIIHKYVDLGLRVKWAAYNIGANKPYENGTYFGLRKTFPMCDNDSLELIKFENGLITIATNSDKDIASLLWGGELATSDRI
jgi:serine/threonine protein kinase